MPLALALAAAAALGAPAAAQEVPAVNVAIANCPVAGPYIQLAVDAAVASCGVEGECAPAGGMDYCPGASCALKFECFDAEFDCGPYGVNGTAGDYTCLTFKAAAPEGSDADLTIGVGFQFGEGMALASAAFPEKDFGIIDGTFDPPLSNVEAFFYREDQVGFLAGVAMCEVAKAIDNKVVGIIGGIPIPPVKAFVNGAATACADVCADCTIFEAYSESFNNANNEGEALADQMVAEGVGVVFAAGGGTGSAAIRYLATQGVYVIGVDSDEYYSTFEGGAAPGSEFLLTSALKRVDSGIVQAINCFLYSWEDCAGQNNVMDAANDGVGMAPCHDACEVYTEEIQQQVADLFVAMQDDAIDTGVDLETGDRLTATITVLAPGGGR